MRTLFTIVLTTLLFSARSQTVVFDGLKEINGTKLYLKIIGKGEPIVVVHGGPGMNHSYFLPHLLPLAKKNQLVFFDQRASGKSTIPSADSVSLDFFVEDIETIRKELKLNKVNLLAHSWGAIPAVQYAIDYPDHINKLILCNAVPLSSEFNQETSEIQKKRMTKKDSTDRAQIINSAEFKSGQSEAYKKLLMLSFRHSFFKSANFSKLQFEMPANYIQASRVLFTGLGKDLNQYNYYERIKDCLIPTLIIHGSADAIPQRISELAQANFQKSTLRIFKASGHFAFIEEPERFRKEIAGFLNVKR